MGAGSEASAVAAARLLKKQNRAREWEQSRRKTASKKTASQMENKFRNRRLQTKMGSHQNGKGSETKKEMRHSASS